MICAESQTHVQQPGMATRANESFSVRASPVCAWYGDWLIESWSLVVGILLEVE